MTTATQKLQGISCVPQAKGGGVYQIFRHGRSIGYVNRCGPGWEVYDDVVFSRESLLSVARTMSAAVSRLRARDDVRSRQAVKPPQGAQTIDPAYVCTYPIAPPTVPQGPQGEQAWTDDVNERDADAQRCPDCGNLGADAHALDCDTANPLHPSETGPAWVPSADPTSVMFSHDVEALGYVDSDGNRIEGQAAKWLRRNADRIEADRQAMRLCADLVRAFQVANVRESTAILDALYRGTCS